MDKSALATFQEPVLREQRDKLYDKACVSKLTIDEYDRLMVLIYPEVSVSGYVNRRLAEDIRESLKDGE